MKKILVFLTLFISALAINAVDFENSVLGHTFNISKVTTFDENGKKIGDYLRHNNSMSVKVTMSGIVTLTMNGKIIGKVQIISNSMKVANHTYPVVCCRVSNGQGGAGVFNFYFSKTGEYLRLEVRDDIASSIWYS